MGFPSLARLANGFNALVVEAIRVAGGSPSLSVLVYDEDDDAYIPSSPSVFGITLPGAGGDGRDGPVHYTANTTLTADVRATTILVDAGVTVKQAGFLQLATTSITNNGTISDDGNNASGATPGAARSPECTSQVAGGSGGARAAQGGATLPGGFNGQGTPETLGAEGGAGGGGVAQGTNNGWDIVSTTSSPFASTNPLFVTIPDAAYVNLLVTVGCGGGGGNATVGGTGGAGAGMVRLGSPLIINNGVIRAKGGNGSAGTGAGGHGGGGGGGGRVVIAGSLSGSGTLSVVGGTGGAGNGGGSAGANGSNGTVHLFS